MKQNGARPYDGHLLLAVQHRRLEAQQARQVAEICREEDKPLPSKGATAGGDPVRLRGIPVPGFGGAIRGTRPTDGLWRLDQEAEWRSILTSRLDRPATFSASRAVSTVGSMTARPS